VRLLLFLLVMGWVWCLPALAEEIDWRRAPAYVTPPQIQEDLEVFEQLIRDHYVHYERLSKEGHDWDAVFRNLRQELLTDPRPLLTHHFQEKLLNALLFTEDPTFRADLHLPRRHYQQQLPMRQALYTDLRLARDGKRWRVLPENPLPEIANHLLVKCDDADTKLFPILPARLDEERVMLGVEANRFPEELECAFEDALQRVQTIKLPLFRMSPAARKQRAGLFQAEEGRVFYVRWQRDGAYEELAVRDFFRLPARLQPARTLIMDVRGNTDGSFGFIEKWLQDVMRQSSQNVIVREKLSSAIVEGLLRQMEWQERQRPRSGWLQDALQQQRGVYLSLQQRLQEERVDHKWVETKFLFNGKPRAPKWDKRLIVLANEQCGPGCQFLVALSRQLPQAFLLGSNTGPYPDSSLVPMFQLPQSGILVSINHQLHLDHERRPVSPAGYKPDYWLFPSSSINSVMRFANSQ
jgi:hypothetical protein